MCVKIKVKLDRSDGHTHRYSQGSSEAYSRLSIFASLTDATAVIQWLHAVLIVWQQTLHLWILKETPIKLIEDNKMYSIFIKQTYIQEEGKQLEIAKLYRYFCNTCI